MWIFCCGMRRSGSTVQFQFTARLVEEAGLGRRVEWVRPAEFGRLRKQLAGINHWKVFKSHICTEKMAREFKRNNAMGVYIYRDLRDVFVSTMRKYNLSFDDLFARGLLQDCVRQYRLWTALPRVLVSKYEEMMAGMQTEVARIARHLGIAIDAETCARIAAEHSVEKQKERIEQARRSGNLRKGVADSLFDPQTNLHVNHIQSGAPGGWRQILTRDQISRIEAEFGEWLAAHGYPLSCELDRIPVS